MTYPTPADRARAMLEAIEERAAILEFDAGLTRDEAERRAREMTRDSFRDADQAHPCDS
ncbi:MAG: hypothetical protein VW405_00280 [Rhodospirillaceae bacterium]